MKLKKYIDFIKESLEEKKIWNMSQEDITEIFLETLDQRYTLDIQFGFVEKRGEKEIFNDKVLSSEPVRPAIWIAIIPTQNVTNEDVTDNLNLALSLIEDKYNSEISLYDEEGQLNREHVKIKGGLWISQPEGYEDDPVRGYVALFVKQKQEIELTDKDIFEHYDLEKDENTEFRGENIYLHISMEDMTDMLLGKDDPYKDTLVKRPIDEFWDNYHYPDYSPDNMSFLNYTLSKENLQLLTKCIIKECGGLEKVVDILDDDKLRNQSEEKVIEILTTERFWRNLEELMKDSEVSRDIKEYTAQAECDAHAMQNYKELAEAFDKIVSNEIGEFQKEEKKVTKHYFMTNKEGQKEKKEYTVNMFYYITPFNNEWIEYFDTDFLNFEKLITIVKEWRHDRHGYEILNPYFSDYGNVDTKQLNKDITDGLMRYLEKGNAGLV